jgi:GNAT superfamily N-acetyltransferase
VTDLAPVTKLRADHELDGFDCGKEALNNFLRKHALSNLKANSAQTYVLCQDVAVVGYYSLAVGSVTHEEATERVKKGLPRHSVPVMILARLAVDKNFQKRGIGPALLKDALIRTARAAEIAGVRALLVHAKDADAKSFYEHFDFESSPTDQYHLFLIMKDLQKLIGK